MAVERRRRRGGEKKENHERWVISYADFMTLLLATFVVLYAISSINVTKYRLAADALSAVFSGKIGVQRSGEGAESHGPFENNPSPVKLPVTKPSNRGETKTNEKIDGKIESRIQAKAEKKVEGKVESKVKPGEDVPVPPDIREKTEKLNQAYNHLGNLLQELIADGKVHMARNGLTVVIDISASVLFDSGKADLVQPALSMIDKIGGVLKDQPYHIQVNGYTDNAPIHTAQFSSNWELSAMRAISVVRRFVADGIDPTRLVGAGFGEFHPIVANDTVEGMTRNRRVAIVVTPPDTHPEKIDDPTQLDRLDPATGLFKSDSATGVINDRGGGQHLNTVDPAPGVMAPMAPPATDPAAPLDVTPPPAPLSDFAIPQEALPLPGMVGPAPQADRPPAPDKAP